VIESPVETDEARRELDAQRAAMPQAANARAAWCAGAWRVVSAVGRRLLAAVGTSSRS